MDTKNFKDLCDRLLKKYALKRKKLCTTKIATMEYGVVYIFKGLLMEKYIILIIIIFWIIVMRNYFHNILKQMFMGELQCYLKSRKGMVIIIKRNS